MTRKTKAATIINLAPETITVFSRNPRQNDHAVPAMAEAINAHGFRVPVLVRAAGQGWELVDGHLRLKAAQHLGLDKIPALDISDLPEGHLNAFRVSVNRMAELADWDNALLVDLLTDTVELGPDNLAALTGFSDEDFMALAREEEIRLAPAAQAASGANMEPVNKRADQHRPSGDTDTVNLSMSMTVAERREVLAALDQHKEANGLSTRSASLMAIIRAQAAPEPTARKRSRK